MATKKFYTGQKGPQAVDALNDLWDRAGNVSDAQIIADEAVAAVVAGAATATAKAVEADQSADAAALDRAGTAADRIQTGLDRASTTAYVNGRMDASAKRYLYRKLMAFTWSSVDGKKAAAGISADDGTLLAKLPIQSSGDISMVRSRLTGLYMLGIGIVRSFAFTGGSVNAGVVRYFARRKVLHLRTSANGALGDAITDDGYHRAKHAIMPGKGMATAFDARRGETTIGWGSVAEDRTLGGGNIVSTFCRRYFNRELVTHLLTGGGGPTGLAIGVSGTAYIAKPYLPPVIGPGPVALSAGGTMIRSEKRAGRWQLVRVAATGAEAVLATLGNNNNPVISGANVLYQSDRGSRFPQLVAEMYWQPVAGGTEKRVFPKMSAVYGFGDSLSQGTYQAALAALLGVPVHPRGIGGQNGLMVGMRQGALPVNLTLAGNSVATGVNTVSAINGAATGGAIGDATSPLFLSSPASNQEFAATGWLALPSGRLYGTVKRTGAGGLPSTTETYTFTPASILAAPLACPAGTLFELDEAALAADYVQVIWAPTNDVLLWSADTATSLARCQAMAARLNPLYRRFAFLGPTILSTLVAGTIYHNGFNTLRAALAAALPDTFIDIHYQLVTNGLALAGLAPTAGDLADIANDVVPRSLRADDIHLNAAGYGVVALIIYNFMHLKGWY